jgi:hypothetical protein
MNTTTKERGGGTVVVIVVVVVGDLVVVVEVDVKVEVVVFDESQQQQQQQQQQQCPPDERRPGWERERKEGHEQQPQSQQRGFLLGPGSRPSRAKATTSHGASTTSRPTPMRGVGWCEDNGGFGFGEAPSTEVVVDAGLEWHGGRGHQPRPQATASGLLVLPWRLSI